MALSGGQGSPPVCIVPQTKRNSADQRFEEGSSSSHVGLFDKFYHGELRGPGDGHEQIELALGRSYLCHVDMKEADWIAVELLSPGLVSFHLRQRLMPWRSNY